MCNHPSLTPLLSRGEHTIRHSELVEESPRSYTPTMAKKATTPTAKAIIPLTVREILDAQIGKKLA
jgi:hypothetical protein